MIANPVEKFKTDRITFTFPVLNAARTVLLLVAGKDKTEMIQQVLGPKPIDPPYPVMRVQPAHGEKIWFLDRAAPADWPRHEPAAAHQDRAVRHRGRFGYLRGEIARVELGHPDLLHVDIMDGPFRAEHHLRPGHVKKIKSLSKLPLDVHLMISRPRKYITRFIEARRRTSPFTSSATTRSARR